MRRERDDHGAKERFSFLSSFFLRRLHEIAEQLYAPLLKEDVVRMEEAEEEILRYYAQKKSGLQDVYSYYGEQWDYFYQVAEADDAHFLGMLQRARSVLSRFYAATELDVEYYVEQLARHARSSARWQALRRRFMEKWQALLEAREVDFQMKHIGRLCEDYYRMVDGRMRVLRDKGRGGGGFSPRLVWLQLTCSPELRMKIKQLAQVMRNSELIRDLDRALGRKEADEARLYQAMNGKIPVELLRPATHSDIAGITEGNNLNSLLPVEYCYLSDKVLEGVFYRRYVERKLAVFDGVSRRVEQVEASSRRGADLASHAQKGPFVVCVDTSGSMRGERELLAKAVVLSLALKADCMHRRCRVVLFSNQVEVIEVQDLYKDLSLLEAFLCNAFHGGSDMTCAMQEAVGALLRDDYLYADLLWVSDFELPPLGLAWRKRIMDLKQREVRVYAVAFGNNVESSYLDLADRVWRSSVGLE